MRILWPSAAPISTGGYGQQTALNLPRLAALGHTVTASGALSFAGAPLDREGIQVLPGARQFALGYDADLVAVQYWKPALEQICARLGV
jgi:hypothetical protein